MGSGPSPVRTWARGRMAAMNGRYATHLTTRVVPRARGDAADRETLAPAASLRIHGAKPQRTMSRDMVRVITTAVCWLPGCVLTHTFTRQFVC